MEAGEAAIFTLLCSSEDNTTMEELPFGIHNTANDNGK